MTAIVGRVDAQPATERTEDVWRERLATLREQITGPDEDLLLAAVSEGRNITSASAATALADRYAVENRDEIRVLWLQALGKLDSPIAGATLVNAALQDTDKSVREAARSQLELRANEDVV